MASVYRTTAIWSGFQGAPGYTKFSWSDLSTDTLRNAAGAAMRAYFFALTQYMHSSWSIQVQSTVQEYDMATGQLLAETGMTTAPANVVGTGTPVNWAQGAGFFVGWKTGLIFNGHRVQGRTFHCPAMGCFDLDGTLSAAAVGAIGTAADALIAGSAPEFAVWSRLFSKPVPPAKPVQIGGAVAPVTARVVKDGATALRSRRV